LRTDHDAAIAAIREDLLSAPGATTRGDRALVLGGSSPEGLRDFLEKVCHASYKVTEEDITALKGRGLSEDAIFELTVVAAFGIAYERLATARMAMASSE